MKTSIVALVLLGMAFGCKKDDDDDKDKAADTSATSSKLSDDEIFTAPAGVKSLEETEMKDFLSDNSSFWTSPSASAGISLTESDCFGDKINALVVSTTATTITLDQNIDITSCLQSQDGEVSHDLTYTKATMNLYTTISCEGVDVSSYNGKTVADLANLAVCTSRLEEVSNAKTIVETSYNVQGQTLNASTTSIQSKSAPGNTPCSTDYAGDVGTANAACFEISKSVTTGAASNADYASIVHNTLTFAVKDEGSYYTSGTMDVFINDWSGKVTFHEDGAAPTYSIKQGAGTPVTGTISAPSNFSRSMNTFAQSSLQRALLKSNRAISIH